LTTGFNPVKRKEPTKLYLLGKRVPEERQILTTGFNPVVRKNLQNYIYWEKSSGGTTDINNGF
jgi:hypothetical protein